MDQEVFSNSAQASCSDPVLWLAAVSMVPVVNTVSVFGSQTLSELHEAFTPSNLQSQ